jgi:stage V sporulation protein AD
MRTIFLKNKPRIIGAYSIVGPKEGRGPFGKYFDYVMDDDLFGEKTYEKAERKMVEHAVSHSIRKAGLKKQDIELMLSGDLLNQIISSSYAARTFDFPYLGLFGACSTMAETIAVGSLLVDGGYMNNVVCSTGSHFSTAERQFRFPLELGNQRVPTSQWTATACGSCVISKKGKGPRISAITFGRVIDFGINDVNNMGAAMAPSAMDTILTHFQDTKRKVTDYDLIATGDLGKLGSEILIDLLEDNGLKLAPNYTDFGHVYFSRKEDTMCGGSGCGVSASMLNSFVMRKLLNKEYKRVLFVPTGALMSTTASQQGETIPGVSHAIVIECDNEEGK